jgi:hypothetical protein
LAKTRSLSAIKLEIQGIYYDWPIWEKELTKSDWKYDQTETCYFLRGKVIVTPEGREPPAFGRGDLVTFPAGMRCTWEIFKDVRYCRAFAVQLLLGRTKCWPKLFK